MADQLSSLTNSRKNRTEGFYPAICKIAKRARIGRVKLRWCQIGSRGRRGPCRAGLAAGSWAAVQPVRLCRGTESLMTRPSAFHSREMSPPSSPVTVARTRRSPNPSLPIGGTTGGPPCSDQVMTTCPARSAQWTSICPAVEESAPYFTEFVANSCSSSARLEIVDPEISISQPMIENRRPSPSPR